MLHKINLDYFTNGYSVATGGSCVDLPVAVWLGNISASSYLYYLAIKSAERNWSNSSDSWPGETAKVLSDLGFQLHSFKVNSWSDFLSAVKNAIDNHHPLLVPVSYHKLFYYLALDEEYPHMIMITGYDIERQLLLVVDCNIVEHGLPLQNREYTLYQLPLTFDIFKNIWEGSNMYFERSNNPFLGTVYAVSLRMEPSPAEINDMRICKKIFSLMNSQNSLLARYVSDLNGEDLQIESADEFILIRRQAHLQLTVVFDLYEKILGVGPYADEWQSIRSLFFKDREALINRLEINYKKGVLLTPEEAQLAQKYVTVREDNFVNYIKNHIFI